MTCASCGSRVEKALQKRLGVERIAVNLPTEEATVRASAGVDADAVCKGGYDIRAPADRGCDRRHDFRLVRWTHGKRAAGRPRWVSAAVVKPSEGRCRCHGACRCDFAMLAAAIDRGRLCRQSDQRQRRRHLGQRRRPTTDPHADH
ncbi:heavy-metal-associated domain-containing protein [Cupriavidus sp. LEh25]|uniref:heavy-metal-associated domain-containing protein n=1 Tax=Cupriavidus consociatus TaxID=2821357 RepID=UPI001AE53E28|nr:heavy-metal-associated domain-containing protein [Cupriavidus sp. LEh25]